MNIKRYIVNDMNEALIKIKNDLGEDAVILNNRPIKRNGFWGLFRKPLMEVVVAYDNNLINLDIERSKLKEDMEKTVENNSNTQSLKQIEKNIASLNLTINNLSEKLNQNENENEKGFSEKVKELLSVFNNHDVCEEASYEIAEDIQKLMNNEKMEPFTAARKVLNKMLGKPSGIKVKKFGRTVIMLVGPTGVGKTTTIAKLAAGFRMNNSYKIGIITADVYRIAAYEQLKTYAEILDIPISVVHSPEDITKTLTEFEEMDMVIIDTAGKGLYDQEHQDEIKKLIKFGHIDEVYLVISAVNGFKSCKEIIKSHSFLSDYKLIISKLDENPVGGSVINALHLSGKPLSYITFGQNVPDDYELADTNKIVNMIIKDDKYERSSV